MFRQLGRMLSFFRNASYLLLYNKQQQKKHSSHMETLYKLKKLLNILIKYFKNYNSVNLFSSNLHSRENFKIIIFRGKKKGQIYEGRKSYTMATAQAQIYWMGLHNNIQWLFCHVQLFNIMPDCPFLADDFLCRIWQA